MAVNISRIETGGGELHGATISVTISEKNPTTITVTLTKDSTAIEQKNFDSNGMCTFTDIQESGDYTVAVSDGAHSNSTTATVTGDNIVNKTVISVTIDFVLDGSTATPLNDVSIWLRTDSTGSSVNAGHTTLAQVIADPDTLNNLMRDQSAMQYLARSTGFADEGCASETFMTYLGASSHVDSTVLNSDIWSESICNSTYFESVLKDKVPTMTSNTQPSGKVFASSSYSANYAEWYAFDGNNTTMWLPSRRKLGSVHWIQYKFVNPICIKKVYLILSVGSTAFDYVIQASNDGSIWERISNILTSTVGSNEKYIIITNNNYYNYYRLTATVKDDSEFVRICSLQFYGRSYN